MNLPGLPAGEEAARNRTAETTDGLELMARLQFLRRNDGWVSLFDRFLDDRDRDFVWHPHRGSAKPHSTNPDVWALFPLDDGSQGEDRWSDVTFRLGLIARLSGRPIEPV